MEAQAVKSNLVLILDFGSQYTHLITRRIRSLSVFSLCISGTAPLKSIADLNPRVIILSGGPHSVHTSHAPSFPDGFIEYVESNGVFVLGICYGLQLIVQRLGGEVRVGEKQEYGRMEIEVVRDCGLFGYRGIGDREVVWMSHGDEAVRLPEGFEVVARSHQGTVAAVENRVRRFYGLQYHPEVTHSPQGMETLRYFLFDVCGVTAGWKMEDVLDEEIKVIKGMVGPEDHVICALSGGVDSAVAATLVHKAIGERLHCVFVDNGLLRYKERERVMETFERDLHLPVTCVDATKQFLSNLKGVVDPEVKRKIIGKEFISTFDAFAQGLEHKLGKRPDYLVQGTLYPDVIESCPPPGSGRSHSHTIKSHHNVGGLPKDMKLKLIEPLKLLFKDEVRELGRIMEVPMAFLKRHPFPGPGLAVTHSPQGMETLQYFLFDVCGVTAGWKMEDVLDEEIKVIKGMVGPEDHVICALSGGVDSTVAATLVHKAIGERLHCVFVDNGLLRYKERERVMKTFERDLHLPVTCVDATEQFLSNLKGVVDPEVKRKIIGKEFISIFDAFAQDLEHKLGKRPGYLVQGTLYPDVIESCPPPGSGRSHSHTIKSHHNVGGLPKDMKLKLIEPLKLLFKDEVRELGRILEVPVAFLKRHPFPGPGLAVRVLGDVTEGNALEILRQVDEIFIQSIKDAGIYDFIWQAFAVFLPIKSVGVQGDQRTHSHVVALRAVTSQDGMTADWYNFEHKFLDDVARKICNNVRGVNRVVQDITSKPPSTIEWE
ncbi:GMP synthase [Actinidia chinensis var. chinensis]|uniref:GMP synthase [glutamine-hydrolyzing] n=1 Tax=Actinidia chinensis var. chinensis TaxID=1590841 RepID=A0A2R6Q8E2_ACTCC|nr:GMP synthase [Actinidia chinensis var. chinensis]